MFHDTTQISYNLRQVYCLCYNKMKSKTYNDIQDKSIHLVISMREDYKRYVRSFGKKHSVSTISTKAGV